MDYDLNDYDDPPPDNDHSLANAPAPVVETGLRELLAVVPPHCRLFSYSHCRHFSYSCTTTFYYTPRTAQK